MLLHKPAYLCIVILLFTCFTARVAEFHRWATSAIAKPSHMRGQAGNLPSLSSLAVIRPERQD